MSKYKVIGMMSGTSLDGLDIAYCEIEKKADQWSFRLLNQETVSYNNSWISKLSSLENSSALAYVKTDVELGKLFGHAVNDFIKRNNIPVDFIASHGHTIFHQPEINLTTQIGNGAAIAAICQLPIVNNFRIADVALGGQGAPLVPIGDQLLFSDFKYCLNLGGFANISVQTEEMLAFDICPCNIVLNFLVQKLDLPFDDAGKLGKSGSKNEELFKQLNNLSFYSQSPPKSLGKEWVVENVLPILEDFDISVQDKLHTFYKHIAFQVKKSLTLHTDDDHENKILITGGGAFNDFLIEELKKEIDLKVVIPDQHTINYKEAIVFALLGVLRWRNEPNCLRSVTGAAKDVVGGTVHWY